MAKNNNDDFKYGEDEALDDVFGDINGDPKSSRKEIQSADDVKTVIKQIRVPKCDYDLLEKHFKDKRLRFGTGVRMVLADYIKNNDLK